MGAALSGGLDDIESIIKIIKDFHTSQSNASELKEQTIVLVTSVMTWVNTPKKLKKNFPKKVDEDGNVVKREDESETEDDQGVLYFTDKDFQ